MSARELILIPFAPSNDEEDTVKQVRWLVPINSPILSTEPKPIPKDIIVTERGKHIAGEGGFGNIHILFNEVDCTPPSDIPYLFDGFVEQTVDYYFCKTPADMAFPPRRKAIIDFCIAADLYLIDSYNMKRQVRKKNPIEFSKDDIVMDISYKAASAREDSAYYAKGTEIVFRKLFSGSPKDWFNKGVELAYNEQKHHRSGFLALPNVLYKCLYLNSAQEISFLLAYAKQVSLEIVSITGSTYSAIDDTSYEKHTKLTFDFLRKIAATTKEYCNNIPPDLNHIVKYPIIH